MKPVYVVPTDGVELFDLSGPVQVFHEAALLQPAYDLRYVTPDRSVMTAQRLPLGNLSPLPVELEASALVLLPANARFRDERYWFTPSGRSLRSFAQRAYAAGAHLASVCVGAFVLGEAGLLDGVECTTHWKRVDLLQARYPRARVQLNRLFVINERISTSAGVASGVDMALAFVEHDCGSRIAAAVARELVVATRRPGTHEQLSPYFAKRDHTHHEIHLVQDWLLEHPSERVSLEDLGRIAGMSVRTLTRQFRAATGTTIKDYMTAVRLERSRHLLREERLTVDDVAARCGFGDARQLRRLWRSSFGTSPSEYRASIA